MIVHAFVLLWLDYWNSLLLALEYSLKTPYSWSRMLLLGCWQSPLGHVTLAMFRPPCTRSLSSSGASSKSLWLHTELSMLRHLLILVVYCHHTACCHYFFEVLRSGSLAVALMSCTLQVTEPLKLQYLDRGTSCLIIWELRSLLMYLKSNRRCTFH